MILFFHFPWFSMIFHERESPAKVNVAVVEATHINQDTTGVFQFEIIVKVLVISFCFV